MDAGIAAVCGALAGSVATIGAALATGWSQREGARIAARSEHRRSRRESREQIYREFINAVTDARSHTDIWRGQSNVNLSTFWGEYPERFDDLAQSVTAKWTEVALAGPPNVYSVATRLERDLQRMALILWGLQTPPQSGNEYDTDQEIGAAQLLWRQISDCLEEFVSRAQLALDDDGSSKPSH